uniref:Myosin motor domain-containing protein n=1 Tax=Meloidogyne enterolobii TaxID=390850 RepID=A0A6V7XAC1_MELEN|nr:unnamed protein product [Meloidogyne enterolobii]
MEKRLASKRIIEALELDKYYYRIGQSKVFFRAGMLAHLEEERDRKLCGLIISFQSQCRAYLARRLYQKRVQQSNAIRILQRNGLAWLKLRDWQWWRLYTKVKPLLQVTNQEEAIRKRDEELNVLRDRLANNEKEMLEIQLLLNRTEEEKISLQAQLQVESDDRAGAEELADELKQRNIKFEDVVNELTLRLEEVDEAQSKILQSNKKLDETVKDLESQLEDEESARQKLMLDKKNLENKLKELQERFALMQDANERLQLEKKSVDNKLVQLSDLLQEGEDKAKQGMKYRQKLENQLSELTERYESELRLREFAEKEKKNIASGIAQQSSMLDEKHSKIEYLTTELGKYEAELVQLRNKSDDDLATISGLQKHSRKLELLLEEAREDWSKKRNRNWLCNQNCDNWSRNWLMFKLCKKNKKLKSIKF